MATSTKSKHARKHEATDTLAYENVADLARRLEWLYYTILKQAKRKILVEMLEPAMPAGQTPSAAPSVVRKKVPSLLHVVSLPKISLADNSPLRHPCKMDSALPVSVSRTAVGKVASNFHLMTVRDRTQAIRAFRIPLLRSVQRLTPPPMQSWMPVPHNIAGKESLELWQLPYVDDETDLRAELKKAEYRLQIRVDRRKQFGLKERVRARTFGLAGVQALLPAQPNALPWALQSLSEEDDSLLAENTCKRVAAGQLADSTDRELTTSSVLQVMKALCSLGYDNISDSSPGISLSEFVLQTVTCTARDSCTNDVRVVIHPSPARSNDAEKTIALTAVEDAVLAGGTSSPSSVDITAAFRTHNEPVCPDSLAFESTFCRYCYRYSCTVHLCQPLTDPHYIASHFIKNQLPEGLLKEVQCALGKSHVASKFHSKAVSKRLRTDQDAGHAAQPVGSTGVMNEVATEGIDDCVSESMLDGHTGADAKAVCRTVKRKHTAMSKPSSRQGAAATDSLDTLTIIKREFENLTRNFAAPPCPPCSSALNVSKQFIRKLFLRAGGICCLVGRMLGISCSELAKLLPFDTDAPTICIDGTIVPFPAEWRDCLRAIFDHCDAGIRHASKPIDFLSKQARLQLRLLNERKVRYPTTKGTPIRPCYHEGPCKDNPSCSCNEACQACTKFCGCSAYCESRWWGCACKSGCKRNSCPCLVANRECDPDHCVDCHCGEAVQLSLCLMGQAAINTPVSEGPRSPWRDLVGEHVTTEQRCAWLMQESDPTTAREALGAFLSLPYYCTNAQLQGKRKKRTRVALSSIPAAGCGLFIDDTAEPGELIREYAGEIISTSEADRRGVLYDMMNISYLFDIDDFNAVDATMFGNKIRFANHADKPNCSCVIRLSRGQHRIGIYAARNLKRNEELFFNYGYRTKVAWQKDPTLARKPTVAKSHRQKHDSRDV